MPAITSARDVLRLPYALHILLPAFPVRIVYNLPCYQYALQEGEAGNLKCIQCPQTMDRVAKKIRLGGRNVFNRTRMLSRRG
jgi:hypothetical protein